ncbi:ATP-dependent nuclease [Shewanella oncorhynchi]|uniref:ATP-dependent nuclease n=1 Tax=Shewanella oncorhynchi TaxID=2726434 RepID=UPI0039F0ADF3
MDSEITYPSDVTQLTTILFKEDSFINLSSDVWSVSNIKRVNFFIGPNNSGKSRLLRHLYTQTFDDVYSNKFSAPDFIIEVLMESIIEKYRNDDDIISFATEIKKLDLKLKIENISTEIALLRDAVFTSQKISKYNSNLSSFQQILVQRLNSNPKFLNASGFKSQNYNKIYIPLLRGLRNLTDADFYYQKTKKDYFSAIESAHQESIFTGQSLYQDLINSLLGEHEKRKKIKEYELFLSEHFFNNNEISLIPRIDNQSIYIKEGNKEERPIHSLGDGLQSIIILTFKIFTTVKPTLFFIEEPELNLHPSLQRAYINALNINDKHLYFFTTHSNHFIDLAQELDDVALHRISQKLSDNSKEITQIDSISHSSYILADLGVKASSVLLANCSIWIEGITDKLYFSTFMNKYIEELGDDTRAKRLKNYKENLHYIFTEYQGGNITHWDFNYDDNIRDQTTKATSLTSNILLIADNDIEGKADRITVLKENLKEKFLLLDYKEIENHIPVTILIKTAEKRWDTFNKKELAKFDITSLTQKLLHDKKTGIGTILEKFITNKTSERLFFKDKSGTIKDKVKFCHTAISIMRDPETEWELTPELKTYCKQIWDHIEKCNPK